MPTLDKRCLDDLHCGGNFREGRGVNVITLAEWINNVVLPRRRASEASSSHRHRQCCPQSLCWRSIRKTRWTNALQKPCEFPQGEGAADSRWPNVHDETPVGSRKCKNEINLFDKLLGQAASREWPVLDIASAQ